MPFNQALFWFGLTAFGTGLYYLLVPEVKRRYSIGMTAVGALACAYTIYRDGQPELPASHLWVILLVLTWALLGYVMYTRHSRPLSKGRTEAEWRDGFSRPRFEIVDDYKFQNEEIAVDNKSFRRCSFKNVKLLFHGHAPFEFVEGTTLDVGSVIFGTDDPAILTFNAIQQKFASIPGAKIEHGALDSKGKEIPLTPLTVERVDKPKEPSKIAPFLYTNVISLAVDEKKVSRGKNIKIRYVIESSEDASDKIWLGASVMTDKKTGDYFSNTDQDKYISLVKGRHEYDRDLKVPMNAPFGVHLLRANLWHVVAEGKSMIIARGTPIDIEIVA